MFCIPSAINRFFASSFPLLFCFVLPVLSLLCPQFQSSVPFQISSLAVFCLHFSLLSSLSPFRVSPVTFFQPSRFSHPIVSLSSRCTVSFISILSPSLFLVPFVCCFLELFVCYSFISLFCLTVSSSSFFFCSFLLFSFLFLIRFALKKSTSSVPRGVAQRYCSCLFAVF